MARIKWQLPNLPQTNNFSKINSPNSIQGKKLGLQFL